MGRKFCQGKYTLRYPEKYMGDKENIRYMSSWELYMHRFFDNNKNVIRWGSETIVIKYIKPTDGKVHRYLVDYYVEYKDKNGKVRVELIECKPHKQTVPSKARKSKSKLFEDITYAVNVAKWKSAKKYAEDRGWSFRIVTEKSLFNR